MAKMQTLLILLLQREIILDLDLKVLLKDKKERSLPLSEMLAYWKKIILVSRRAVFVCQQDKYSDFAPRLYAISNSVNMSWL